MTSRLLESPVGRLLLTAEDGALVRISWTHDADDCGPDPVLDAAVAQLEEYFAGRRRDFDLPLRPRGTAFRIRTWREMQRIPFGKTATYGEIADALGSSARAVGGACGANPLPLVIPCHRVVGRGGAGGYSGGAGVATKQFLLDLEGVDRRQELAKRKLQLLQRSSTAKDAGSRQKRRVGSR